MKRPSPSDRDRRYVTTYEVSDPIYGPRPSPGVGRPIIGYKVYSVRAEVSFSELMIDRMIRKAFTNKNRKAVSGPVTIKLTDVQELQPPCTTNNATTTNQPTATEPTT